MHKVFPYLAKKKSHNFYFEMNKKILLFIYLAIWLLRFKIFSDLHVAKKI
jgi:hypothetical protein